MPGHVDYDQIVTALAGENASRLYAYRILYEQILRRWPSPKDWFGADERVIYHVKQSSNFYWILWSIKTKTPLDAQFLMGLGILQAEKYIQATGIDIATITRKLKDNMPIYVARYFAPYLLKLILCTGKYNLDDLSVAEIDETYFLGIYPKTHIAAFYHGLHYLGVIPDSTLPISRKFVLAGNNAIKPGHLTYQELHSVFETKLTLFKNQNSILDIRYQQIIERWPIPDSWFSASEQIIIFKGKKNENSNFYWVIWSLMRRTALNINFVKNIVLRKVEQYFKLLGVDVSSYYEGVNHETTAILAQQKFWLHLLRLELVTGKFEIENINKQDVEKAFNGGLFQDNAIIYLGLRDLGVIQPSDMPDRIREKPDTQIDQVLKDIDIKIDVDKPHMSKLRLNYLNKVEEKALVGGHLSGSEFLGFVTHKSIKSETTKRAIYNQVVTEWPCTQDWFNSKKKTIYLNKNTNSNVYWLVWSLIKGKPLGCVFIRNIKTMGVINYLKSARSIKDFEVTIQRLYAEGCSKILLLPSLLRVLLYSGKRTIYELNLDDIEQAERDDVGCVQGEGYYHVRLALYLLGVTSIPPKVAQENLRRLNKPSPFPECYRRIAERFLDVMQRRVFNESVKREKETQLATLFKWWITLSPDNVSLRMLRRREWLEYIAYIKIYKKNTSPKTQGSWLSVIPLFFEWGWVDCPDEMPEPFELSSADYGILYKLHKPNGHKSFKKSEHGDILIRYILELKPVTIVEKMLRASVIIHATSGARSSEITHLGMDVWRYDEEDSVSKIVLSTVDKMKNIFRPVMITQEGIKAIKEIEVLRREQGNLVPRYDKRIKESYVHLFEYKGRLIANKNDVNRYMNRCKVACGLVTAEGKPVYGGTHAWRHRFGRRVFEMSDADVKVVQHLLGHKEVNMSRTYTTEDQASRNAAIKDEIASGRIAGQAKDVLLWLIDQKITIHGYVAWQKALQGVGSLGELLKMGNAYNLGYGWCIAPCQNYKQCFICQNYLAEEEHIPDLKQLLVDNFQSVSYDIYVKATGDIEKALQNTKTRKTLAHMEILKKHLEQLGVTKKEITKLLMVGGEVHA